LSLSGVIREGCGTTDPSYLQSWRDLRLLGDDHSRCLGLRGVEEWCVEALPLEFSEVAAFPTPEGTP